MTHIHSRLSDKKVKLLIRSYEEVQMCRAQVEEAYWVGKARFFALLKLYRKDPRYFCLAYYRSSPPRPSEKR